MNSHIARNRCADGLMAGALDMLNEQRDARPDSQQ